MTHLYIIRHAEYIRTDSAPFDLGLSTRGVRQAELLRDRLVREEIRGDLLVSSTLPRARHTAEIIAPALKLPIQLDEDFEEWHNQDASLSPRQFMDTWVELTHEQLPYHRLTPRSETWLEFKLRAVSALNRLLQEHTGKTIVLVCHGGVVDAAFIYFFGLSNFSFPRVVVDAVYTAITHWEQTNDPSIWALRSYNDDRHLADMPGEKEPEN